MCLIVWTIAESSCILIKLTRLSLYWKKKSCQRIIKSAARNNVKISNKLSIQFEMILYDVHSLFKQRQIHTYYFFSCQTLDIRGNGSSIMFAQYVSNQKLVKLYHTNKILANNFALPLIFFGTYFFYPNYASSSNIYS